MVWIKIRTAVLSALIWVQTVCKGYQQTTKVADSKEVTLDFNIDTCSCMCCALYTFMVILIVNIENPIHNVY